MPRISFEPAARLLSLLSCLSCLASCATSPPNYKAVGSLRSLCQLQNLHAEATPSSKQAISRLHAQALKGIAMSVGAQAGLAWRSKYINTELTKNTCYLDRIFNFNSILLDHNVVPPVLEQANTSLNLSDAQTLRINDRIYHIVSQAHFTTAPPQWHNYLWMNYQAPEMPLPAFLPKTAEERAIWSKYATTGWQDGVSQADAIFSDNVARLTRDYTGMVLYRALLVKGMVSKPFVAHTNLGITGDSSNLHINDQIFKITALPKLQVNSRQWKPVITHDVTSSTTE